MQVDKISRGLTFRKTVQGLDGEPRPRNGEAYPQKKKDEGRAQVCQVGSVDDDFVKAKALAISYG